MAIKDEIDRMINLAECGISYEMKDVTEILVVREPRGPREVFRIKFRVGPKDHGMWEFVRDEAGRPALYIGNEGLQGAYMRQAERDLSVATKAELDGYRNAYEKRMTQLVEGRERARAKELGHPLPTPSAHVQQLNLSDLSGADCKRAIARCAEIEILREFIETDKRKSLIALAEKRIKELSA